MKNFTLYLILTTIFLLDCYAQESRVNAGDKKYEHYAFVDAIKIYQRIAEKGYKSEDMFRKLGDSYYFNSRFEDAAKWYGELFGMNGNPGPEYYYRYAQSLKSAGQIDKANKILEQFNAKFKDDSRGKSYKEDVHYLDIIKANSGRYTIENAGINSKYSDYGTFVHDNKIYFASARDTGNFSQRKHKWTGDYFTNLYVTNMDTVKVTKFETSLNSKFHESSPVFTKDGKTVYFTRNNYVNGKKGADDKKNTLIKIYKATKENDKWTNITALPFSSDNYSTAHPALSPDEKTLYFASDMPGTLGQSDLYKVDINADGSFGTPVNLGKSINTEGKETFPFVTENEIYFASDGHPGLGGLDVFSGEIDNSGNIGNIQNVGADVNSAQDDFAYIIDPVSRKGYFSSNKDGGRGSDDIYKFLETRKLKCIQELNGIVTDVKTGIILPGAKVSLYEDQIVKSSTIADVAGFYSFPVDCGKNYNVRAEKEQYQTKEVSLIIGKLTGKTSLPIDLDKEACKLIAGEDLGKCFGIERIYFDLDKWDIRPEAAVDLVKILTVLNDNPSITLDVRSYTDSRATFKYNQVLSNNRSKSIIYWLVRNGIKPERLTGKGYGETQLVNQCSDDVKCSEDDHQKNRRSEFIISSM